VPHQASLDLDAAFDALPEADRLARLEACKAEWIQRFPGYKVEKHAASLRRFAIGKYAREQRLAGSALQGTFYHHRTGDPGPARLIPFEPGASHTLWKRCRMVKPDCTPEEILAVIEAKIRAHARQSKPIENWQGFLIVAVPRSFEPG